MARVLALHGFLGHPTDWQHHLCHPQLQAPDLYQAANQCQGKSIADLAQWLWQSLAIDEPVWLLGYSLGARLAMHWLANYGDHIKGAVLVAGHGGLTGQEARIKRWRWDCQWAHRFEHQPLADSLRQWYQQPLFAPLTPARLQQRLSQLSHKGSDHARLLKLASIAKQANLGPRIHHSKVLYLSGALDLKYCQFGQQICADHPGWRFASLAQCLHNPLQQAPQVTAELIHSFLQEPPYEPRTQQH